MHILTLWTHPNGSAVICKNLIRVLLLYHNCVVSGIVLRDPFSFLVMQAAIPIIFFLSHLVNGFYKNVNLFGVLPFCREWHCFTGYFNFLVRQAAIPIIFFFFFYLILWMDFITMILTLVLDVNWLFVCKLIFVLVMINNEICIFRDVVV